jgi:type I restriction enzyme S subunit
MSSKKEFRTYQRADCAVFRKTAEAFGGLSNMAPGFPVRVNGVRILTVEALYQACRFPHRPEVQRKIIEQTSPMTAKMVGKPFRDDSRPDWDRVRVKIMRWVLRLKLAMHWAKFSELLLSTDDRPIVEDSRKDDFWGAMPTDSVTLVGMNVLGRLLMELREEIKQGAELRRVEPPEIPNFLLFGESLGAVDFRTDKSTQYVAVAANTNYAVNESSLPLFADAPVESPILLTARAAPHQLTEKKCSIVQGLKPYAEYKESGIAWARSLPSTWKTERAKWLFTKMARPVRREDEVVTCFRDGMVTLRKNRRLRGFTEATVESGYQGIRKGDLVIHGMDAFAGAIGVSDSDGKGTPVYNVCQPRPGVVASYYAHAVREMSQSQWILALAKGIRERSTDFRYEMFGNQRVPLPPENEQAAIVRFLDHANRKIDGFIRAKRKLIGLLNEQKQAIIHHAVTRGLNPEVKLKPSGVRWLGDIPAHWEAKRIKYLLREVDKRSQTGKETLLSMRMHHGLVVFAEHFTRPPQAATLVGFKIVKPGQFVVNRMQAGNGVIYASNLTGLVSPDYAVFNPISDVSVQFLGELFRSRTLRTKFRSESKGLGNGTSGFLRLYNDRFGAIHIPLPPRHEQDSILNGLGVQVADLNTAIARTEREIALMQEYRTRLTADIVTGKLDVREAAAKLPDPPTETAIEPLVDEALEEIETEEIHE